MWWLRLVLLGVLALGLKAAQAAPTGSGWTEVQKVGGYWPLPSSGWIWFEDTRFASCSGGGAPTPAVKSLLIKSRNASWNLRYETAVTWVWCEDTQANLSPIPSGWPLQRMWHLAAGSNPPLTGSGYVDQSGPIAGASTASGGTVSGSVTIAGPTEAETTQATLTVFSAALAMLAVLYGGMKVLELLRIGGHE